MSDSSPPPVTLADVARKAGVSTATASMALRKQRRISPATRHRVQRAAKELGYVPNPNLTRLMAHLRLRRKPAFRSVIAGLTTEREGAARLYAHEVVAAARKRAHELGYGFHLLQIPTSATTRRVQERELRHRGIEGVIIFPLSAPQDLRELYPTDVAGWFARERPDALIVSGKIVCERIARTVGVGIPGPIGFAVTNCHESPDYAGIDEMPEAIGTAAMELLHAKLQIGEKGVPEMATVTMINGAWKRRATVRRQTASGQQVAADQTIKSEK